MNPLRAKPWPRKVRRVTGPEAELIRARYERPPKKPKT